MFSSFGIWELLALLAAGQGFFLAAVLSTHSRGHRTANRLLGALVLLYSFHLLHIVLYWTKTLTLVPHLWGTVWFFPYVYGVLLYLYTRCLSEEGFRLRPIHLAHLIPFVLCMILFGGFYTLSAEVKRRMLVATYELSGCGEVSYAVLSAWGFQFVHFIAYLFLSWTRIGEHQRSDGDIGLRWLRSLLAAFAVSFACWFAYGFAVSLGFSYQRAIDYAATFAMTLTIYAIGYAALRQPEIFLGPLGRRVRGKYESPGLSPAEVEYYERKLLDLMRVEKPYTQAELRLNDLADRLGIHPHELSRLINQRFEQNFNDFLNRYRVEEVKRLFSDPARAGDTLLSLSFEAGFNNKTTFNQAFKKFTRTTPSRYRAAVQHETSA